MLKSKAKSEAKSKAKSEAKLKQNDLDLNPDKNKDIPDKNDEKSKKRDFSEKVVKFIQYDDLIKETMIQHRKEITELKTQKKKLELSLLDYLEKMNNDIINYGENDVLKKVEKQKKAPLNKEIMRVAIIDDMKKSGFIKNDEQGDKIIERMFESMESKRPVTNVIELKRKSLKQRKQKDS